MRLNIGCGADPWGDVRLDKNKKYFGVQSRLNIVADATCLPFRDEVFKEVRAYHVLEHLLDWKSALKEWMRVASSKIDVKIPTETYIGIGIRLFLLELSNLVFLTTRSIESIDFPKKRMEHVWAIKPQSVIKTLVDDGYMIQFTIEKFPFFKPLGQVKRLKPFLPKATFEYRIVGVKNSKPKIASLNSGPADKLGS